MQVDDSGPSTNAEPAERIRKWRRWDFEEEKLLAAAVDQFPDPVLIADGRGLRPLTLARQRGYAEMVAILEAAGARP